MLDLLIIGSGISAFSIANSAKEQGINNIKIYTKENPTSSLSCMAQGGINAYTHNKQDSVNLHIEDTLKASVGLGDKKNITYLCKNAKNAVDWLSNMGVPFQKDENGNYHQRKLAGSSHKRACYGEDYTGRFIINALYEQTIKNKIPIEVGKFLLNFIIENKKVVGATFLNYKDTSVESIYAKSVAVATGGFCGMYAINTSLPSSTGDGIAAALRAGIKLSNIEFVQFHPTALKNSNALISESARGEGGLLVNKNGKQVVNALARRDEVSRAVFNEIKNGRSVFLDLRHLGEEKIEHHFPRDRQIIIKHHGIDPVESLVEITPSAHYSLGGIDVDSNCKSSIDGLYAVGECSNIHVHGANRLGANSLLECVVFGIKSAQSIKEYINSNEQTTAENTQLAKDKSFISKIFKYYNQVSFYNRKERLLDLMYKNAGIIKKDMELRSLLRNIKQIQNEIAIMGLDDKSKEFNQNLKEFLEFMNILDIAEVLVYCSINRTESRGTHFRDDYDKLNSKFSHSSVVSMVNDVLKFEFKDADI